VTGRAPRDRYDELRFKSQMFIDLGSNRLGDELGSGLID
jgi:hypothetical protein